MRFAARVDRRLTRRLRRIPLDRPIAETARELASYAESLGLTRPSYACLRLHIANERLRRAERDAALEVAAALAFTRSVVPTVEGIAADYRRTVDRRLRR
jgi:hypothetical protein